MFHRDNNAVPGEILAVGNEIVSGLVVDTNSSRISRRLQALGLNIERVTAVGDDAGEIRRALAEALDRVDLVVMTGGLGATHDDITKQVLAEFFDSRMVHSETVRRMVERLFQARGRPVPEMAYRQADVPDKAALLLNEKGTAPGLLFRDRGRRVYALPGVPLEVDHLLERYLVPDLAPLGRGHIAHRILQTTGIVESALWERVGALDELESWVQTASLPSHLGVRVRLSARGGDEAELVERLDRAEAWMRTRLGEFIYGRDDDSLESVIGVLLKSHRLTLAVAESCTGGLIGHRLTNIPGSSEYFLEGAVTYSNRAKETRLDVPVELLTRYGAVSAEVAAAMAEGMRRRAGTDFALAVTGIAGPDGGTPEKPVGLTFMAVADAAGTRGESLRFNQDRVRNKDRAAQAALNLLRLRLIETGRTGPGGLESGRP